MGRSEQKQAFNTSKEQNATDFANSQKSYADTQKAISDYNDALGTYASQVSDFAGKNPYTSGGEFSTDSNRILSNVSDAGAASERAALADRALRTGQNMNAANAAAEDISEANTRNLGGELAGADQQRIAGETAYDTSVLGAQKDVAAMKSVPISANENLYSTSGSQANSALGQETEVAKTPGFWDQFALTALSGGAQVGSAFCPCEGEPIDLSNGMTIPVQNLTAQDEVLQFGGGSSNLSGETPSRVEMSVEVETEDGAKRRVAFRHAFKTIDGGYVYAFESEGVMVHGKLVPVRVTKVTNIGPQRVYPLYLKGNHTYCAGGLWALD